MASQGIGRSGIAARYATALFELADEGKSLDRVADDLRQIKAMVAGSDDLRRLVGSPRINRDDQVRAMTAVLDRAGISPLTRKFVGLMAANRRLFALTHTIDAYLEELARRRGEMTADVIAAAPLSPAQTEALTDRLRQAMGAKVAVDVSVDPSLLGGMIIKVGSRMVDSSLQTKLNKLQFAMKGVG
ncbi:MAG: F0F1 ATP synthase subunit delta [Inquilinaceae bacterium]